jgi:hypothetical protein
MRCVVLGLVTAFALSATANAQECAQTDTRCKYKQGVREIGGGGTSIFTPAAPSRPPPDSPPPAPQPVYTPPKSEPPTPPTEEQLRLDSEARAQSDKEYYRHLQAQQGVSATLFRQRIDQILSVRWPEYPLDDVGQNDAVNRITWSEVALYYALALDDAELTERLRQFVYDDRRTALRDKDARKMVPTRSVADIESSLKGFYSVSNSDPDRFQGEVYRWVSEEVAHVASERAYGGRKSKYR